MAALIRTPALSGPRVLAPPPASALICLSKSSEIIVDSPASAPARVLSPRVVPLAAAWLAIFRASCWNTRSASSWSVNACSSSPLPGLRLGAHSSRLGLDEVQHLANQSGVNWLIGNFVPMGSKNLEFARLPDKEDRVGFH